MPSTTHASAAFCGGSSSRRSPSRRAATAIGSTPRIALIAPSSDSSPTITVSSTAWRVSGPDVARRPNAIGRSKDDPAFRTSAGARLTVMRWCGKSNPELRIAERTRSRLSRTVASGNPTMVKWGSPNETSTSMWTGYASTPNTAALRRVASTIAQCCKRRPCRARRLNVQLAGVFARQMSRALKLLRSRQTQKLAVKTTTNHEHQLVSGDGRGLEDRQPLSCLNPGSLDPVQLLQRVYRRAVQLRDREQRLAPLDAMRHPTG